MEYLRASAISVKYEPNLNKTTPAERKKKIEIYSNTRANKRNKHFTGVQINCNPINSL